MSAGLPDQCPVNRQILFRGHPIGDRGAAAERLITQSRLPIPGGDELGTIQKLGFRQKGPGKIGTIEYCFEEVRALEMGACQIRVAEICSPEIGAPKIGPRKIEPAQIEPSQTGPRQVRRHVVFRPPLIPRCGAAAEHRDMLIVWHVLPAYTGEVGHERSTTIE
jgi:hypothetical protein